ncbi:MAG TPA: S8 family serine peptidase, partial [Nanoarchaeota archaeon]|nr:S8 family serine peptidase [Nanoarchaeota archaeon]
MKRWISGAFGAIFLAILLLPFIFALNEYEPDNVWQNATTISTNGSRQAHTFDTAGDVDYVNFTAVAGVQYVIETHNLSDPDITDTVLNLYSTDGTTLLDTNDDIEVRDGSCVQCSSRIVFDSTANGTYYVNISEFDNDAGGSYQVSILEQGRLIASLVSHISATNVTRNNVFEFTTSLQCLSADCYNVTATLDPEIKSEHGAKQTKAGAGINAMLESNEKVDVIVIMKQKAGNGAKKNAALSYSALSELSSKGFEKRHEYATFGGFSGSVTKGSLALLENNPNVEAVYYDSPVHAFLTTSIPQINADDVWARQVNGVNITGSDETVCIIDTGINYSHPDFGSCARTSNINGGSCPKVVGGYDYVNTNSDPYDDNGHGSHVAGIAASQDSTYRGVAPSAKIVSIKVLNSVGSGSSSNVIAGIDWCVSNAASLNITAISMSLGLLNEKHEFHCPAAAERASIDAAVAAGISVFIAAGNDDFTDGISTPACIGNATSVGGVDNTNSIDFNRGRILDVLAPGVSITATNYSGTHTVYSGTSMSTPHAAALALLLKQYAKLKFSRNLTAEELKHAITANGKMVYDSSSKLLFPRIDALASINGKGIIPTTVGAKPFYSLTPNPHNASCLAHISQGETCSTTWQVNVTGDTNDTYAFFAIYTTDYKRNDSAKVNLTIANSISVSLNVPLNGLVSGNQSQIFNCSASGAGLSNITLYGNFNGTWHANRTANATGNSNSTLWQFNLTEGDFTWNCRACNAEGCGFASANYSLSIDTSSPLFNGLSYTALIELGDGQSISVNISDSHMYYANLSYSGANYSMSNTTSNFSYSYTPLNNATINFTIYAVDTAGNSNSTDGGFIVNDTSSGVRIKSVSLASSTIAYGNNQTITAYVYDQWQPLMVYLDHNSTNITMPNTTIANFSYTWAVAQCGTVTYKIYAHNSVGTANTTTGTFTSNNCCGNSVCDGSDTCSSCSADCEACTTTASGGGGGGGGGGGAVAA